MLNKIFNTLRVLCAGPTEPEDQELIPSTLFVTRENFNDAVIELFNKGTTEDIYDFLKYTICIDTNIRYRLDEHSGGIIEGEKIQPEDYVDLLNTIDTVFGVNDDTFGINVSSGIQHRNPALSGLTGAVLQIASELLGEDQFNVLRDYFSFSLNVCATNPSATNVWWMDALNEIYSYELADDGDEWFNLNGEEDQREAIQAWFLKITNHAKTLYDAFETALQTLPPNSISTALLEMQLELQVNFVNDFENKIDMGHVCETIPLLRAEGIPHNIEQCLATVLLADGC